jgi:hypothetical protein
MRERVGLCTISIGFSLMADTASLLSHLGRPLVPPSTLPSAAGINRPVTPSREASDGEDEESSSRAWSPKKREDAARRLHSLVEELVRTERSYLLRIKALKAVGSHQTTQLTGQAYADPLRSFAKDKHTQIIPLYEAKNLFANIDQVVPASMSFLADLEEIWLSGRGVDHVGDVCLKHVSRSYRFTDIADSVAEGSDHFCAVSDVPEQARRGAKAVSGGAQEVLRVL